MHVIDRVRDIQKFHHAEVTDLAKLAAMPTVVFEQKLDGSRALVIINAGSITFNTQGARALTHSAASQHFGEIRKSLEQLQAAIVGGSENDEIVLDGELMIDTGHLYLFDCPSMILAGVTTVTTETEFAQRRLVLESLAGFFGHRVHVVEQAKTEAEKLDLAERVFTNVGEGIMAKDVRAKFEPGKRIKSQLKVKFCRTADVVVLARDTEASPGLKGGTKLNAKFGVWDEGKFTEIGNCSMIGKDDAQVGDVIEVEFLYMGAGGRLVQPRMKRTRDDKSATECTFDQFETYSKAIV